MEHFDQQDIKEPHIFNFAHGPRDPVSSVSDGKGRQRQDDDDNHGRHRDQPTHNSTHRAGSSRGPGVPLDAVSAGTGQPNRVADTRQHEAGSKC